MVETDVGDVDDVKGACLDEMLYLAAQVYS